ASAAARKGPRLAGASSNLSDQLLAASTEDETERRPCQPPVPGPAADRTEEHRNLCGRGEHREHPVLGVDLEDLEPPPARRDMGLVGREATQRAPSDADGLGLDRPGS